MVTEPVVQYRFPRMPIGEIVDDMALFEYPISKNALKAPSADDVRGVLTFFLNDIYSKQCEDKLQPSPECLDVLAYPELHEDSVNLLHFLRACQTLFRDAQYHDFGLRDLLFPDRGRFHWQLSALINFAKFRQTRLAVFEAVASNADELVEQHRQLEDEVNDLESQISEIQDTRAEEEPALAKEKQAVAGLTAELSELHKQQLSLTDDTRDLKNSLSVKNDNVSAAKLKLMSDKQEVSKLSAQVVSSPERVKSEIAEMSRRLDSERAALQSTQRRTRDLRLRAEALSKVASDVTTAHKLVEECNTEMEREKELQKNVKEKRTKILDFESEQKSIESSSGHLDKQMKSIEQRLLRVRQQRDELSQQARETQVRFREQALRTEKAGQDATHKVEANSRREEALSERISSLALGLADDLAKLSASQEAFQERFTAYHSQLFEAMDLIAAENKRSVENMRLEVQSSQ